MSDAYRFLNPYNFVRYLITPRPSGQVLGDCPPPPHDRYVGLTGRITCTVEAVTPLFISDSHDIAGKVGEHRSFHFFKVNGEPALPASSLRGMLRSVFEAATNSCFAVFDHSQRLEFRERPEFGNKVKTGAGIVQSLPQPASNGQPAKDGEIRLCHVAKAGAYYEGADQWKNVLGRKPQGQPWQCGDRAIARAKRLRQGYVVRELATSLEQLQPLGEYEVYIEGWLKIVGKGEGTSKRAETFFLDPAKHGGLGVAHFGYDEMQEYNLVLAGQLDRGDLPTPPQSPHLTVGDLVWTEIVERANLKWAKRIVRVQVPRTPYKRTVGELLPDHLHHCADYNTLCPACRVFGWVHEEAASLGKRERVAYAGRVRLSHGQLVHSAGTVDDPKKGIPLAILSTPKPTTTAFYLLDTNLKPGDVTYDTRDARLRGRKVYRHQGEWEDWSPEQRQEVQRPGGNQDDQNRTVYGVLQPGAKFTFDLEFECLTEVELGALLWTLELESGMYHRLGFAKPLGFGSVEVSVEHVQVLQPQERYTSLRRPEWGWTTDLDPARYIAAFKNALRQAYNQGSFEALPNVLDLRKLLSAQDVRQIHYPRSSETPTEDGENFKWFVGNKRRLEDTKKPPARRRLPDPELLPLPPDDTAGLRLMDERGNPR